MRAALRRLASTEPVRLAAAVRTLLVAGVAFGVDVSAEQVVAVVAAVETVSALLVRSRVTPAPAGDEAEATDLGRLTLD